MSVNDETRIQRLKATIKMTERQLNIVLANQKQHERKALNKRKFDLGGLAFIAWPPGEVDEGQLLGAILEAAEIIKTNPDKAADWKRAGSAVLQKRREEQEGKKKRFAATVTVSAATEVDAPLCPVCNVGKIVPRPALGGKPGCNNYPRCKYVAPVG